MKSAIDLLKQTIAIIKSNPALFFGIAMIPGIISLPFNILFVHNLAGGEGLAFFSIVLVGQLILVALSVLMTIALLRAAMNPTIGIKEAYSSSLPYFWRYLILSFLVGVVVTLGFFLLIIPGIIFMVWFSFSYYILVVENIGGIEAMKRSKQLVSGRWFMVFGYFVLMLALAFGIGVVFGVLGALLGGDSSAIVSGVLNFLVSITITPLFIIYFYFLYTELKANPVNTMPTAEPTDPASSATPMTSASPVTPTAPTDTSESTNQNDVDRTASSSFEPSSSESGEYRTDRI